MVRKRTFEDRCIDIFSYTFLGIFAVSTLLPFMNVVSKAVSQEWAVTSGKVSLLPVGFQLGTMKYVVTDKQFLNAFGVSVLITAVGTLISMFMTALAAYPLSKKQISGVKTVLIIYVFTMLFSGGMIPNYILIKNLGLQNNLWALMLPSMISVFNLLIIKNYYESLPESLEESARLDGASNRIILCKIVLPLSLPVLATISLFYAVGYWNDYFNAMLYISRPNLRPLQLYLRDMVMQAYDVTQSLSRSTDELDSISPEGLRSATVVAATVPILLTYPYLQKYFIKGILIGSVKG